MLRSLWQNLKDFVYDSIGDFFRTQEEIDVLIEEEMLARVSAVLYDETPAGAKHRDRHTFLNHKDALAYVDRAGIPANYVTIVVNSEDSDTGDTFYEVWIDEN